MRITILCTAVDHPVNAMLVEWINEYEKDHEIALARDKADLMEGDLLFLISCSQIISKSDRSKFKKSLVIHASDLPNGRGWSPHIWEILSGAEEITVSLLEASDKVDTGDIWKKVRVAIPKHALYDEINEILFRVEFDLMNFAVESFALVQPYRQETVTDTSQYRRRTPTDSELDPGKNLISQFDLLRVCDASRFPAFFNLHGHRYKVLIEKINDE